MTTLIVEIGQPATGNKYHTLQAAIDAPADGIAPSARSPLTVQGMAAYAGVMATFTGTSGDDNETMSVSSQWAMLSSIDLGIGTDVLTVELSGGVDIAQVAGPTVSGVETGKLIGTSGNDYLKLTGAQLDAILSGTVSNSIDLGEATGDLDAIYLTSTSAKLNTLAYGSILGVEMISAYSASTGVTINLSAQGEAFSIFESSHADLIIGGAGNDYIYGGTGDTIDGGAGNDKIEYRGSADSIEGGTGTDTLSIVVAATIDLSLADQSSGDTANVTGFENASAAGSSVAVSLTGDANANALTGSNVADTIDGGAGADLLSGGNGDDTIDLANSDFAPGEAILGGADSGSGTRDQIKLTDATTVDFTTGTVSGIETLTGSSGDDDVTMSTTQWAQFSTSINLGGGGADVLNVKVGVGTNISTFGVPAISGVETGNLTGSSGNDTITLTGDQLDAIIQGDGTINLDERAGDNDTINLTSTSTKLIALSATDTSIQGVERISFAGATGDVTIDLSAQTEAFTITGGSRADTITGGSGADTINCGDGDDTVAGGAGSDSIAGAAGNDYIYYDASDDSIAGGMGTDTLRVTGAATIDLSQVDQSSGDTANVTDFEKVDASTSSAAVSLTGSSGANSLTGGLEADTIDGGAGADTIYGGDGDDTIFYDGSDLWIAGEVGTDTLLVTGAATIDLLAGNISGFENVDASRSSTAVSLTGDANANVLTGGSGADTITGGDGDDTITGGSGSGADTITGGAGTDAIVLTNATTVDFTTGSVSGVETLTGSTGTDTVTMKAGQLASFTTINLGDRTDVLNVVVSGTMDIAAESTPSTGGVETVNLTGSTGNDTLTLTGAQLDAILSGTASNSIDFGEGFDTIVVTGDSAVFDRVANGSIENVELISATGATAGMKIDLSGQTEGLKITGGAGADTITGGLGADTIAGGGGNDTIKTGGTGVSGSRLYGATGDDKITGGNGADRISGGAGADLNDGGKGADRIDGGAGADTVNGGAGDDTVSGGAGADMLSGGAGNDVYVVDNTGDKVIESVSGGLDGIQSSITFSLVSVGTVETLTLTGSGSIKGTGNAYNNKLTGNTGANTLDGGAGNDMLNGGVGKDMLTGGVGKDTFFFTAALSAANSDKINDFSVADDTVRMENAVFAALKATGTLAESAFYAGAAAHDASDRIIYNKATGALSYDADGKGGTAAVQFATLGSGLALTHADFMVV